MPKMHVIQARSKRSKTVRYDGEDNWLKEEAKG